MVVIEKMSSWLVFVGGNMMFICQLSIIETMSRAGLSL